MSDDIEDLDLDDEMTATLAEINSRDENANDEHEAGASGEDDAVQETPDNSGGADGDGRERDERGRFKAKDEGTDQEDGAKPDGEDLAEDRSEEKPAEELNRPPSTWRAAAKSIWKDLPETARQEILKREQDIGTGIGQYKQAAEYGQAVHRLIEPYMPMIQAAGSTPEATLQNLLNTAYRLRTGTPQERGQMLAEVAQQFGADLSALTQQPDEAQQFLQPHLQPLQEKVQRLEQELARRDQLAMQTSTTDASGKVEAFKAELDESGQPKHLYFDDVREDMANLIEIAESQGRQLALEDAYDQAVWARPDIRSLVLAEQQKREEAKRQEEAKRRAAEAKRTAGTNVRSGGAPKTAAPAPTGSLDDTMRDVMDDIRARAE